MFKKWIDESELDLKNDFYDNSVISVRQWIVLLSVMMIPGVNVVMLLRWAFANKELAPANKVNWARASVIIFVMSLLAIIIVAGFILLGWYIHNH